MRGAIIFGIAALVGFFAVRAWKPSAVQGITDAAQSAGDMILEAIGMRGIRNNNPGNIRHSTARWQGMSPEQTDSAFVQFISAEYGIRALSKLLDTYANSYGLRTVRGIIGRYAPVTENNTSAYVNAVANALGVAPDQVIDVAAQKQPLIQAIIKHENGIQPYSLATIAAGASMA